MISRRNPVSARLEQLVPLAVVITAGCEPCARRMVTHALDSGAAPHDIRKVVGLVARMQQEECFLEAVGPQVVSRMVPSLALARKTLSERVGARAASAGQE